MNLERHVLGLNHERLFPTYAFFDVTFPFGVYDFCAFLCVCVLFGGILILAAVLGRNWN